MATHTRHYPSRYAHQWVTKGQLRERCAHCNTLRSWDAGPAKGWIYCGPGEAPTTKAPGCYVRLPGVMGAANVDGD